MDIRRIATARAGRGKPALVIQFSSGRPVVISQADLVTYDTPAKLRAEAARQAGRGLAEVYFHFNRDGSVAVATGQAPAVWPEDDLQE